MRSDTTQTEQRKRDHLQPFRAGGVSARDGSTLLECVQLVHSALPQLGVDDLEVSIEYAGHRFDAPLFITGMTGGTSEAADINKSLARIAQRMGIGFGLGSGRAMLENPSLAYTYQVRREAPDVFLAWNLGGVQLRGASLPRIKHALDQVEANALCIHLNPAQELMQPEGDRDFSGVLEAIGELTGYLNRPVIVKETGSGISREVGERLQNVGVRYVDVAGKGGTSWVGVELQRQGCEGEHEFNAFWDWGIPTAASLCDLSGLDLELIASGGIRTGLDAARAMALGAKLAGVAAPVIEGYFNSGEPGGEHVLNKILRGLKITMLLTGCRTLHDLRNSRRVINDPLRGWSQAVGSTGRGTK